MKRRFLLSPILVITLVFIIGGALILWFYAQTRTSYGAQLPGPSSFSRSAIGYAGLADILGTLGVQVVKARNDKEREVGGLLIVAEPPFPDEQKAELAARLQAPAVLLILPKWSGKQSGWNQDRFDSVFYRGVYYPQALFQQVAQNSEVFNFDKVKNWSTNIFPTTPHFNHMFQLVRSPNIHPLIANDDGILLGEIRNGDKITWVLSDPDILSNHGIKQNAQLAVEILQYMRAHQNTIVFDETIHGFGAAVPEAPPVAMFRFPFVIVTLLGCMTVILLLWTTIGRFGPPEQLPVPLTAGKQGLVENVARLMDFAGHHKRMTHRYVEATIQDAGRQLHAPKGLQGAELVTWLTRLGRTRGTNEDCSAILKRAHGLMKSKRSDATAFVTLAKDIYRWKQEIINGPSGHSRTH
jgi:hypothetical protein